MEEIPSWAIAVVGSLVSAGVSYGVAKQQLKQVTAMATKNTERITVVELACHANSKDIAVLEAGHVGLNEHIQLIREGQKEANAKLDKLTDLVIKAIAK